MGEDQWWERRVSLCFQRDRAQAGAAVKQEKFLEMKGPRWPDSCPRPAKEERGVSGKLPESPSCCADLGREQTGWDSRIVPVTP